MNKITIVVRDGCRHCSYILSNIEAIKHVCSDVDVVDINELDEKTRRRIKATPAIIIETRRKRKTTYVTGNVYGVVKIIMLCSSH